jgi:Zn-dependent protease with chaperone function
MYYLLGLSLALAALLTINAGASVLGATLWRAVKGRSSGWSAHTRARFLFTLRTLPPAVSFICVVVLLLPAYFAHEPQRTAEVVSAKLAALALVSICGLLLAILRGLASWRATRRLVANWLGRAVPVRLEGVHLPVYSIRHSFPVIAIVGALRPRLFIASQLFDLLTEEELAAALLHESGHLATRDNLRRPVMRACCDVLSIVPSGRTLDRAWKEESEAAADEYTARQSGASGALALASALIKIARMVPEGARPTMPAGAFLVDEAGDGVTRRVRQLMRLADAHIQHQGVAVFTSGFGIWIIFFGLLAAASIVVTQTNFLLALHTVIEHFVSALQ